MFNTINQAIQNKNNPMELFKQVTNNYTPEQMNNFYNQAKQMGFSEDLLNQVKSGISTN